MAGTIGPPSDTFITLSRRPVMIYGMLPVLTMTVVLPTLVSGPAANAQGMFRLLGEKEIKAKVIGNDIIDSSQWSMYFRLDSTLIRDEISRKVTGVWKIQKNKLCLSNRSNQLLTCYEVWMSGQNIRLRVNKEEETFDAVVAKHQAK
jgi:hypothetical protein